MKHPDLKEVSEVEWRAFLEKYPRKLVRDVFAVCEPPYVTFNDFELAPKWPESIVASCIWRYYETDPLYNPPFRILVEEGK